MTVRKRISSSGFSVIEVIVVLAIALILTAITIQGFRGTRDNIKTAKAANVLTSLFQQARQRAITNRIPHSVTISRMFDGFGKRNLITISSINTTVTPAVTNVIRQEYLLQDVTLVRPTEVPLLLAPGQPPENVFQQVAFMGMNTVTIFFNIDGSVTSGTYFPLPGSNPFTASFFVADTNKGTVETFNSTDNPALTRVVSLYSSTGGIKTWAYNGTVYTTGNKNF